MAEGAKPEVERSSLGDEVKQRQQEERTIRTNERVAEKRSRGLAETLQKLFEKIKGK